MARQKKLSARNQATTPIERSRSDSATSTLGHGSRSMSTISASTYSSLTSASTSTLAPTSTASTASGSTSISKRTVTVSNRRAGSTSTVASSSSTKKSKSKKSKHGGGRGASSPEKPHGKGLKKYNEIWEPSDSPEETFSDAEGANDDGEWPIEIVGEEVDMFGRVKYEAKWDNWHRKDQHKTSNTWDNELLPSSLVSAWEQSQQARRDALASQSTDIAIWCTLDLHQTETRARWDATDEKWERRQREGPLGLTKKAEELKKRMMEWDAREAGTSAIASTSAILSGGRMSRATEKEKERRREMEVVRDRKGKKRARPIVLSPSSSPDNMQMDVDDGDVSGWDENDMDVDDFVGVKHRRSNMISPSVSMMDVDVGRARNLLTSQWNDIAQASGAAEITIVNEVDDEAIPPIPEGFVYVESGYTCPPELKPPEIIDDLFLRCDCASCMDASSCECQDLVSVMDSLGRKIYAYHKNGFYNFEYPQGSIVVECNKFCKCPTNHCRNRVAQKPRDIPIQVFKTLGRGWGVCSTTLIRKGKVLGMYGGTIITRAHAESLDEEAKSYCFDLDGQEMMNEGPTDNSESYSVDGRTCGNWTRFLNHSCSPNLQAYQVVYDTIPEMNRPYIAFAALRQIDPREELTIDYDPAGAIQSVANRKSKVPSGATPCRCASDKCRGWVKSIS